MLAYLLISMFLGMVWHFFLFKDLYDNLKIYNRAEPIVQLGATSMLIQGLIIAYLFPFFYREGNAFVKGLQFSLIMGLFLFSISTLANAAKMEVSSMTTWLGIQAAFHLIQFTLTGLGIGLIHRK